MSEDANTPSSVMIAAFEGWNDACQAASNVVRYLVKHYESREIRHIDCDAFYDYQVSRPMLCHVSGRTNLIWPQTTFYEIVLDEGHRIFAQIAPEPNYRWKEYCSQSLAIAEELDVDGVITLGSMFSDCPHSRPLPISVSDGNEITEEWYRLIRPYRMNFDPICMRVNGIYPNDVEKEPAFSGVLERGGRAAGRKYRFRPQCPLRYGRPCVSAGCI